MIESVSGAKPRLLSTSGSLPSFSSDGRTVYFNSDRTGRAELFRVPAEGESEVQVTKNGGAGPRQPPDGRTLYYSRPPAVFGMSLENGVERQVLTGVAPLANQWSPVDDGIYYAAVPDPQTPYVREKLLRTLKARAGLAAQPQLHAPGARDDGVGDRDRVGIEHHAAVGGAGTVLVVLLA